MLFLQQSLLDEFAIHNCLNKSKHHPVLIERRVVYYPMGIPHGYSAWAMLVTVLQKSIRHKSPRMYHGVYSGDRRTTSEGVSEREREERGEEERKAASKAFISVALFYFFARSFDPLFYTRSFGACSTE